MNYCIAIVMCIFIGLGPVGASANDLPSPDQFDSAIQTCAGGEKIGLDPYIINMIKTMYHSEQTKDEATFRASSTFRDSRQFLSSLSGLSEDERLESYRLYVQCIRKILENTTAIAPPPVTISYRVCAGEYESACQQHDSYLYCGSNVSDWAKARCASYTIQRLNTYGGNKCGYSIDAVICTGPK